ncbi:MAG: twin-arginine translocase TatA/TatE family subunit [Acidobacteria bacterium]|nr:twin-arginine translocase TatA/TatE family subunit [Acidobacteriota bacterium]
MGIGNLEVVVILVLILMLLGGRNTSRLLRGLGESIRRFQHQAPRDWWLLLPQQRDWWHQAPRDWWQSLPQQEEERGDSWPFIVVLIGLVSLVLLKYEVITAKQLIVLVAVLGVWLTVGYVYFGRKN